jgi:ubiquinone/menaquinone biosynthesis C-methylase UbiE
MIRMLFGPNTLRPQLPLAYTQLKDIGHRQMGITVADRLDQLAFWNGAAGRSWTDLQKTLDETFAPVSELLKRYDSVKEGEYIIDVGCGCGASSIELAARVGNRGHVLGIDISSDMLTRARLRSVDTVPVSYLLADATSHEFDRERADVLYSRFGVMFFKEPVLAFINLGTALQSGGRLVFACWRDPKLNPWLILPLQATYKHVPPLPQLGPEDPGPFSFASEHRVRRILTEAGFVSVSLTPLDVSLDIAANRGLQHAVAVALSIGPASRALEGQPIEKAIATETSIRTALAPFQQEDGVRLPAAIWIVTALKP